MPKSKKKKLVIALLLAAIALGVVLWLVLRKPAAAPDQPVAAGQTVVVTVSANAFEDMYGYQFQLLYDEKKAEYTRQLTSRLDEIQTIFGKPFRGYELIGATMVGEKPGVTKKNAAVCEAVFTVKEDCLLSELGFDIRDVRVVTSALDYREGIEGWTVSARIQEE